MGSSEAILGRCLKGRYRVDGVLGEGGMGVVYRGTQLDTDPPRAVAIKTLLPATFGSAKARERFQREASLASRLRHPGVAQVIDFGLDEELPFLVMELAGGVDLSDIIRDHAPLAPARALAIGRQLAEVLIEAHRHNLIHRDIKPGNIRVLEGTADGAIAIKVLDFGIAKDIGAAQDQLTTTGALMGTPLYLAPEQATGSARHIDCRADQYAAGVILYEMLAGHPPFIASTMAGVLFAHVMKPPPPLPLEVPEPLRRVVMRMLKKAPAERFAEPAAFAAALAECEPVCARARAAPRRELADVEDNAALLASQPPRRALFAALAGLLVLGAGGLVVSRTRWTPRTPTPAADVPRPVASPPSILQATAPPPDAGSSDGAGAGSSLQTDLSVQPTPSPQTSTSANKPTTRSEQPRPAERPAVSVPRPISSPRPAPDPFEVPVAR